MPLPTAFVSHSDCARHDTGWGHPDHQGRLPGLVRAVYRDMLTLHGHLLDVEAVPATEAELLLAHTPDHLARLRMGVAQAAAHGQPLALHDDGPILSDASWAAVLAATGTALTGARTVLGGDARNAFCMARPPGGGASADAAGAHSLINHRAVTCLQLLQSGVSRVLVLEWTPRNVPTPTARILEARPDATTLAFDPTALASDAPRQLAAELETALDDALPEFVLLGAGFDALRGDPLHDGMLDPAVYHGLTLAVREAADARCGGRLVSVLDGGYSPALGAAVVQHLRALAGLPPA
jgi:acetoin utilization deacetylase AcuC-like enzyme